MLRNVVFFAALLLAIQPAFADALTIPNTFTANTTAQSGQVNANFNALITWSSNIANDNIKTGANISLSKLNLTQSFSILRAAGATGISVGVSGDTISRIAIGTTSGGKGGLFAGSGSTAHDIAWLRKDATTWQARDAADSTNIDIEVGELKPATVLAAQYGGTGANLGAAVQGAVPYFGASQVMTTLAPVASSYLRFNASGDALEVAGSSLYGNYFGDESDGNVTISTNTTLGSGNDDANFIIKQYSNLTINSSCTLEPAGRTRGLIIYVKGNCTINGTLRSGKGASSAATAINLYKFPPSGSQTFSPESNQNFIVASTNYSIPAAGGAGGAGGNTGTSQAGTAGSAGTTGQTGGGGGGAGGGSGGGQTGTGGSGTTGTAYSGGSGGGAGSFNWTTSTGVNAGATGANGGAGGTAGTGVSNGSNHNYAAGGAGNPGGTGSATGGGTAQSGATGTGGIIYLIVGGDLTIGASGVITAPGAAGGNATALNAGSDNAFGGGGSGGGSIVVLYAGTLSNSGTITAPGGAAGTASGAFTNRNGGAGGAGSVTGPTKTGGI